MSGIDEQHIDFPICSRCERPHFWIGEIKGDAVLRLRLIYFNPEIFRGKRQKLKKVVMYDIADVSKHGRYATREEIEESYGIHCSRCKNMVTEPIASIIKRVAINYIARLSH